MLGVFADPDDADFVEFVTSASEAAGVRPEHLRVIRAELHGIEARDYGAAIRKMSACIVDVRHKGIVRMAARFGSLAEFIQRESDEERGRTTPLDARILLITRSEAEDEEVRSCFGDFYSRLSISTGIGMAERDNLTDWIAETLDTTVPKVFVSYRATKQDFAQSVAEMVRARGGFVWFDKWNVLPGDSVIAAINRGLGWCTHLVLVVDDTFFESRFTTAEVEAVLYRFLSRSERHPRYRYDHFESNYYRPVIPLFLVDPKSESIPPLLAGIRGIDCRSSSAFNDSMDQLWNAISVVGPRW